jgi:hypothetical protein
MKTAFNFLFIFSFSLLVISCNKNEKSEGQGGLYESGEQSVETGKTQGNTSIEFLETEFDFGTINEGEMVTHSFKFKNTGKLPLIISDSRADCGCTVPNKPEKPILPGEENQIEVKFNSSGKGGQTVNKTVTVIANTEPSDSKLHLKGKVIAKSQGSPIKEE